MFQNEPVAPRRARSATYLEKHCPLDLHTRDRSARGKKRKRECDDARGLGAREVNAEGRRPGGKGWKLEYGLMRGTDTYEWFRESVNRLSIESFRDPAEGNFSVTQSARGGRCTEDGINNPRCVGISRRNFPDLLDNSILAAGQEVGRAALERRAKFPNVQLPDRPPRIYSATFYPNIMFARTCKSSAVPNIVLLPEYSSFCTAPHPRIGMNSTGLVGNSCRV